jgi:hypothetical protein
VERNNPWTTLLSAAGAVGAAVGIVYVIGGVVLSLRYEGFGLSGQQGVALTSREVLFFYGGRSLVIWALLGLLLVLVLWKLPESTVKQIAERLRTPVGLAATAVAVLALMPVLHVWWPLAAIVAVVVILVAVAYWRSRPVALFLISSAAIALVAVAYEADRLKYLVDKSCVALADGDGRECGLLIGQNDRGTYLGQPSGDAYRLLFIPAERVLEASTEKDDANVTPDRAEARRESPAARVLGIEIR